MAVEGLFTHFASVEDDVRATAGQLQRFGEVLTRLARARVRIPFTHAANSGGLLHEPASIFNMVRPGLLTYGILPNGTRPIQRDLERTIQPVLSWKCRVALVKGSLVVNSSQGGGSKDTWVLKNNSNTTRGPHVARGR